MPAAYHMVMEEVRTDSMMAWEQRMYFLRQLKKFILPMSMMLHSYTSHIHNLKSVELPVVLSTPGHQMVSHLEMDSSPSEMSQMRVVLSTLLRLDGLMTNGAAVYVQGGE